MSKPKAKKQKIDLASSEVLVNDVRQVKAAVNHLSSSCTDCLAKWQNDLDRMFERCDTKTLEFLLVSRLGLEGVDCLRNAIQLVPHSFVDCRVEKICEIVNKIAPVPLTEEECKSLLMILPRKLTSFVRRKTDPRAFDDELWELTVESGEGYTAFLGPPNVTCLKPECCNAPLRKHNEVCKATLFDIGGPRPASKISLRCSRCGCIYGYSKYGSKHHNGERYYSGTRDYIEASDVVYIGPELHNLYLSLR